MIETANILEILKDAFSALNDALGDSDLPVESDEEEREIAPVQYAARRVSEVIQILEPARDAQLQNGADDAGHDCPLCNGTGFKPISPTCLAECKHDGTGQS